VLVPRAEVVAGALGPALREKGWTVDEVVAYRTEAAAPDPGAAEAARTADAVTFASSSAVAAAVTALGADGLPAVVVTIGPTTSAAARDAGLTVAAEAHPSSLDGLVDAVERALAGRP
jgi:uroporphyrinogen-III synthase